MNLSVFLLKYILCLPCILGIDVVGSNGCSAPACVFANNNLQFGTGTQTSVNQQGLFVQPFYFSHIANTWYKLTYSNYPLDTAFGTGTGGPNWSGTTVVDLYSLPISGTYTDYSEFIVRSADSAKTVGHGIITATRNITVNGQLITFQNRFSLGENDNFVQITTRVTNIHTAPIQNMLIWVGTRDDYVGTTDVNVKTRGNLVNNQFEAVTTNSQSSHAIMITNPTEGVLFYSETEGVMTSYALCCAFANAYNTNPLTLAPATPTGTDGSYAAVLPIGSLSVGMSASIIWYYAAGAISSLNTVVQNVYVAQVAAASILPTLSASSTVTATPSSTLSISPSSSISSTASITSSQTSSSSPSISSTASISPTSSQSLSSSPSPSPSTSITISTTPSISSTASISSTITQTPTTSISPSNSVSSTISPSTIPTTTNTPTNSVSASHTPSISITTSVSSTPSPTPSPSDITILQNHYLECYEERASLISAKEACMVEKDICINTTLQHNHTVFLACILTALSLSVCINMCCCFSCCRRKYRRAKENDTPIETPPEDKPDIYAI